MKEPASWQRVLLSRLLQATVFLVCVTASADEEPAAPTTAPTTTPASQPAEKATADLKAYQERISWSEMSLPDEFLSLDDKSAPDFDALDVIAADCDAVVLGHIIDVRATPIWGWGVARLHVTDAIKGRLPSVVEIGVRTSFLPQNHDFDEGYEARHYSKGDHVFFLNRGFDEELRSQLALDHRSSPSTQLAFEIVQILGLEGEFSTTPPPYTRWLQPLRTSDEVKAYLRSRSHEWNVRSSGQETINLVVPSSRFLDDRSTPIVRTVDDADLRAQAMDWLKSPEPWDRVNALLVIRRHRPTGSEGMVREILLHDPSYYGSSIDFPFYCRRYPLRSLARVLLTSWGLDAPDDSLTLPRQPERTIWPSTIVAWGVFVAGLIFLTGFALNRPRLPGALPGLASLSTAALLVVCAFWLLSNWQLLKYTFERQATRWEITTTPDGLQVTRLKPVEWNDLPHLTMIPNEPDFKLAWAPPSLVSTARQRFLVLTEYAGTIDPHGMTYSAPWVDWTVWRIPYLVVMLPLFVFPVASANKQRRRRKWQRTGRCVACGYDLRASTGRCPECGRVASRAVRQDPAIAV